MPPNWHFRGGATLASLLGKAMKTFRPPLLAVLVVGCHFDKLFSDASGGAASREGARPRNRATRHRVPRLRPPRRVP